MKWIPWLVLLVSAGTSLAQERAVAPTTFETINASPDARVLLATQVGAITTSDGKVTMTALVITDGGRDAPQQLRGVRFDLEDNSAKEQVYLDVPQLTSLHREIGWIEVGVELDKKNDSPYRVQGTESCWRPRPAVRILCPTSYVGPDWSGLTLGALYGHTFQFPNHRPSELAQLIDEAIAKLEPVKPHSKKAEGHVH